MEQFTWSAQHRVNDVRVEDVGLPLDQYGRPSIPIIYIPNPFYQMTVPVSMCPSNPNSPPTRYEILSQKFFMNCQVKRQYINLKSKNHTSFESR